MTPPPNDIPIRPVRLADVEALRDLRIEALCRHPIAFTADVTEAQARSIDQWRELVAKSTGGDTPDVIMVADAGERGLAGMTGVFVPPHPKLAHAGIVWGVYVRENFRRRRLGERLVRAAIDWARTKGLATLRLSAVQGNGEARRCYERCGFVEYGIEPMTVKWEGKFYDETQMALRL
jgi:RimJ/RimL family protein N-acetyltransferase